ncbi:MAG: TolC family protein [Candidatus Omnitrophica bacterium]|nr:TolC family protein [Candidatus Omnitrophota bacterium]
MQSSQRKKLKNRASSPFVISQREMTHSHLRPRSSAEMPADTVPARSSERASARFLVFFILLTVAFYPCSFAEEISKKEESLSNLIQEAMDHNPAIKAAEAEWKAAKKKILSSWALPDPMIGMDLMGEMRETRVGPEENRLEISQDIPFPVKLWKKREIAKQEAKAALERHKAIGRDIRAQVRQTYYELYFAEASLETLEEIQGLLKKFEGVARARYSNQAGTQRDVAKAQAEVSLTLEEKFMLEQKRGSAAAMMNALLSRGPFEELGKMEKPVKPEMKQTFIELMNLAAENRQEIKEMQAMLEKTKQEKALAKLQNIPDLSAGFVYNWVGSGMTTDMEDGKDSWMFPLKINLPIWQNRIIPEIQAAEKNVEAAEAKLGGQRNETFFQVKDAYLRFDTASRIVLLYETAVIPQAKLALFSDEAGYESGGINFLELLDSERVYLSAKLAHVRLFTELLKSHADLERVTGLDLAGGKS